MRVVKVLHQHRDLPQPEFPLPLTIADHHKIHEPPASSFRTLFETPLQKYFHLGSSRHKWADDRTSPKGVAFRKKALHPCTCPNARHDVQSLSQRLANYRNVFE